MKKYYAEPELEIVEFRQQEAISLNSDAINDGELDW